MEDKNLMLFDENVQNEKWYTIEELAELTGYETAHSMQSNPGILELLNQFSNSKDIKTGGYHNRQKFYSENVLKALKQYQLRNSTSNALKNKEVAISGNISMVINETVGTTIDNLLDNPETLQMLLNKSLERTRALGIENKQLKDIITEYKPKVDGYMNYVDRGNFCNFRDGAKYLGIKEKELMILLKSKYIYKNSVGEYRCYAEYSRYFILRPFPKGEKTGQQLMLTMEGLTYFGTLLKKSA